MKWFILFVELSHIEVIQKKLARYFKSSPTIGVCIVLVI